VSEQAGREIKGVGTQGVVTVGGVTGGASGGTLHAVDMSHKPWYKKVVNRWATRGAGAGKLGAGAEGSSEPIAAQPTSIYDLYPPEKVKTSDMVYANILPQGTATAAHTAVEDTKHTGRVVTDATDASGAREDTGEEERKQLEAVMAQPEVLPRSPSCVPFTEYSLSWLLSGLARPLPRTFLALLSCTCPRGAHVTVGVVSVKGGRAKAPSMRCIIEYREES